MNTDDYRYILTIAEERSISRAAEKLFISQPALSQRIKVIRKELNIDLFTTDKSGIYLTNDGRCFARYAKKILLAEENMKRELQEMHNLEGGSLIVGVSQMSSSKYFRYLIGKFHELYPNIQIDIKESPSVQLQKMLHNSKIDIGIIHMPQNSQPSPDVHSEFLFQDRLVFLPGAGSDLRKYFYSKEGTSVPYISPQILADEPLALPEPDTYLYHLFSNILQEAGVIPHVHHWSRNYTALTSFAEMGLSSTVILQSHLGDHISAQDYCFLDTELNDSIPTVISWISERYLSKISEQFISLAKSTWQSFLAS